MTDDDKWHQVASTFRDALPQFDEALSQANIPLSERNMKALELIMEHMVKVNDFKEFLVSEDYARFVALVDDWYRERYGAAINDGKRTFPSLVVVYGTAFPLHVPLTFSKPGDEEGTVWVGSPASVQDEEDPLSWIVNGPNVDKMTSPERDKLARQASNTASSIRSINFNLKTIQSDTKKMHRDLASAVTANLRAAAPELCSQEQGLLRNAGWELSQATEKALKLYIRRNGGSPKNTHVLSDLADDAGQCGTIKLDRRALALIPSGNQAVNLRYGGNYTIEEGLKAYRSSLEIIEKLAFAIQTKGKYNVREARFLLKKPPWFTYDTRSFLKALKDADKDCR